MMNLNSVKLHDGVLPVMAGLGVITSAMMLKRKYPELTAGLVGFGLAHITLGTTCFTKEEIKANKTFYGIPLGQYAKRFVNRF